MTFKYHSGEVVQVGDHVGFGDADAMSERAVIVKGDVTEIFPPESVEAADHGCKETGGFLIRCNDGVWRVYTTGDATLLLLARTTN